MGLGGVVGWLLRRWFESHDKAAERGRAVLAQARPDVALTNLQTWENDPIRGVVGLANRGPGTARDIRVTFTGSTACGRVPEIEAHKEGVTSEMRLDDAPFFYRRLQGDAVITVSFLDRHAHEYAFEVPVIQEDRGTGRFVANAKRERQRLVKTPHLTKRQLRELDGQ